MRLQKMSVTRPLSILLVLLWCSQTIIAAFDERHPPDEENFDPAEADPRGNITCHDDGDLTRLFPELLTYIPGGSQDPSPTLTVQQFCAKPQYGGRQDLHIGGFCGENESVTFDDLPEVRVAGQVMSPRLMLYCQSRCSCTGRSVSRDALRVQTDIEIPLTRTQMVYRLDKSSALPGDLKGFFDNFIYDNATDTYSGALPRPLIPVKYDSQLLRQHRRAMSLTGDNDLNLVFTDKFLAEHATSDDYPRRVGVSLSAANEIECEGSMPAFALPEIPRNLNENNVETLVNLCAASLLGGSRYQNAGGYCHTDQTTGNKEVWFSDEMTPNPAMRWHNWRTSMAVRYWCFSHCKCKGDEADRAGAGSGELWHFMANTVIQEELDESIRVLLLNQHGASSSMEVKPADRAGFCGSDGKQFCKSPWPTNVLGPIPSAPISIPTTKLDTCGQTCTHNSDCATSGSWDSGCRCVNPKLNFIPDPVFPSLSVGRCLVLTAAILAQSGSLFGKRDIQPVADLSNTTLPAGPNFKVTDLQGSSSNATSNTTSNTTSISYSGPIGDSINSTNSAGTPAYLDKFVVDDYDSLPSVNETVVNENPSWNFTVWINETTLETYASLKSLPSYMWCVCNCTYTSWGCCGAKDGIVHEDPSYNKGAVGNCSLSTNTTAANLTAVVDEFYDRAAPLLNISIPSSNETDDDQSASLPSNTTSKDDIRIEVKVSPSYDAQSTTSTHSAKCNTRCRSTVRHCEYWCTCLAPPVSLFFWFQGSCGLKLPKRSLSGSEQFPRRYTSNSDMIAGVPANLSMASTAREFLGASSRNSLASVDNTTLLGYKATMGMIPDAPVPAPCNESYISFACVESTDGIVHEGPEYWLGALLPEDFDLDGHNVSVPAVPEAWLKIQGLDENANKLNKFVT